MKGLRSLIVGAVMMVTSGLMLWLGLSPVFSTTAGFVYFGVTGLLFVVGLFVWLAGWGALADYLSTEDAHKRD